MKNKKLIIMVSSLAFGVILLAHYIRPIMSQAKATDFEIATTRGDEDSLDNLTFFGYVFDEKAQTNRNVAITVDETNYLSHPLFESMYTEESHTTTRLRSKNKSFIRGKTLYRGELAESKDYLVFIENNYNYFSDTELEKTMALPMDILDKKADKEMASELVIESEKPILQAYISKSLIAGNYLVTEAFVMEESYEEEVVLIVYDLQKQEQVTQFDKQMSDIFWRYGSTTDYYLLDEATDKMLSIDTTYDDSQMEEETNGPLNWDEAIVREFSIYDLKTGAKEVLEVPVLFDLIQKSSFYAKDGMIYNISHSPGKFNILVYDTQTQKLDELTEIYVDESVFGDLDKEVRMHFYGDRVLMTQQWIMNDSDPMGILLLDLVNKEVIFEGTINMEENDVDKRMFIEELLIEEVDE